MRQFCCVIFQLKNHDGFICLLDLLAHLVLTLDCFCYVSMSVFLSVSIVANTQHACRQIGSVFHSVACCFSEIFSWLQIFIHDRFYIPIENNFCKKLFGQRKYLVWFSKFVIIMIRSNFLFIDYCVSQSSTRIGISFFNSKQRLQNIEGHPSGSNQ